jgi:hypothetical protein
MTDWIPAPAAARQRAPAGRSGTARRSPCKIRGPRPDNKVPGSLPAMVRVPEKRESELESERERVGAGNKSRQPCG